MAARRYIKYDRKEITMVHSIEARVPFLDELVIDVMLAELPKSQKLNFYQNKNSSQEFQKKFLPKQIFQAL